MRVRARVGVRVGERAGLWAGVRGQVGGRMRAMCGDVAMCVLRSARVMLRII